MKKKILGTLMLIGSLFTGLSGCPTCVGRIGQESPPFFSEEFYTPDNESMDELYEQLIQDPGSAYPGHQARQATPGRPVSASDKSVSKQSNKKEAS